MTFHPYLCRLRQGRLFLSLSLSCSIALCYQFLVIPRGIVFSCDFLISKELQRQSGDVVSSNIEGLQGSILVIEEIMHQLSHAGVSERTEEPLLITGKGRQQVGHGCRGHNRGPKRHVGPCEPIDDLQSLLLLVDEVEIERDLPRREIVELRQTGTAVQFHLLQFLLNVQLQFFGREQPPHQDAPPDLFALLRRELREGCGDEEVVEDEGGDELLEVEHQLVDQTLSVP